MFVMIFFATFVWNISHSKKKLARYDKKMYIGKDDVPTWCKQFYYDFFS